MRISAGRLALAALAVLFGLATIFGARAEGPQHRVVPGDTLWGIAQLYEVTVDALARLNAIIDRNLIPIGLSLEIPSGETTAADGAVYDVQAGDTLSAIALRFNMSVQALQRANRLADPNFIVIGQRLTIPAATDTIGGAPPAQPHSPQIESIIDELSTAEGLHPGLVKAIAWVESGWQQEVVSPAGAVGIMQITPETAAWLERDVFGEQLNEETSAYDNVKMGVRYLRTLLDATGDLDLAIASYYQGYGATLAGTMYADTTAYVQAVHAVKVRWWP